MRKFYLLLLMVIITSAASSCKNKKLEIMEAMTVARKHVANGSSRLQLVDDIRNNEARMIGAQMKFEHTPVDSLMKYLRLGMEEKTKWKPILDSLELELKKY